MQDIAPGAAHGAQTTPEVDAVKSQDRYVAATLSVKTTLSVETALDSAESVDLQGKLRQLRKRFKARFVKLLTPKLRAARAPSELHVGCCPGLPEVSCQSTVLTPVVETEQEQLDEVNEAPHHTEQDNAVQGDSEVDEVAQDEHEDNDDSDDEDDCEEKNEDACCDWRRVNAISDYSSEHLVQKYYLSVGMSVDACVTYRTKGALNFVVFVEASYDDKTETAVVRIPANSVKAHWTPEDAHMLECEVQLIEYLRNNTSAPVPTILQHSTQLINDFGFPYTLMTKLSGEIAFSIWFEKPYDPLNPSGAYRLADVPSTKTQKKRVNFLRSLARIMAEIQHLSFDKIVMPLITDDGNTAGPSYRWGAVDDVDKASQRPAFETT